MWVISMLYLAYSHDLASLETIFQSIIHACALAFGSLSMLESVVVLCLKSWSLCMIPCLVFGLPYQWVLGSYFAC